MRIYPQAFVNRFTQPYDAVCGTNLKLSLMKSEINQVWFIKLCLCFHNKNHQKLKVKFKMSGDFLVLKFTLKHLFSGD